MSGKPKPKRRATGSVPRGTVAVLRGRSGGKCESCHMAPATEIHHRKYKSRGGTHDVENLLDLCNGGGPGFGGNHSGCHGLAHTGKGQELGLSVPSYEEPLEVKFKDVNGTEYRLHADGTKEIVRPTVKTIPSDQAEAVVGAERQEFLHIGLASSADERVYVLHSARCLRIRQVVREELTQCVYSLALAGGIDVDAWRGFEDVPVSLALAGGRVVPIARFGAVEMGQGA